MCRRQNVPRCHMPFVAWLLLPELLHFSPSLVHVFPSLLPQSLVRQKLSLGTTVVNSPLPLTPATHNTDLFISNINTLCRTTVIQHDNEQIQFPTHSVLPFEISYLTIPTTIILFKHSIVLRVRRLHCPW